MKSAYLAAAAVTAVVGVSCTSSDGLSCGPGTQQQGSECIVAGGSGGSAAAPEAGSAGADENTERAGVGGELASGGMAGEAAEAGKGGQGGTPEEGPPVLISEPLSCGSRNVTGATVITEPITQDSTWSGLIYLPKGLSVQNEPTLSIAPGTKILVGNAGTIEFGAQGSHPTIRALGTARNPIKFCGETDGAGSWGGVLFRSSAAAGSVLRNVLITDGGASEAGLVLETPVLLQGVQIHNSGVNGLNGVGFSEGSSTLVISGSGQLPVRATAARGLELPIESSITGNGLDAIDIGFNAFDTDTTLKDWGVPYRQLEDTQAKKVQPPPLVTIEAGVVYEIKHQHQLDFGAASLHVLGTSQKPVVFQGLPCAEDANTCAIVPSDNGHALGGRIVLSGGTGDQLSYVQMRSLGWTVAQGPLYIPYGALTLATDSPLAVDHLELENAGGWGLQLTGSGGFSKGSRALDVNVRPHFSTFTPNALSLACAFIMTLPPDTKVSGEPRTNVACSGTAAQVGLWPVTASPYILNGFTVNPGGSLTLEAGSVLRFLKGTTFRVQDGGELKAVGSPNAVVQFVQDTTLFSTIGNWNGLILELGSSAQFDYALIDKGGANTGANIVAHAPFTLTHSTLSHSQGWGLLKSAADSTDYLPGNAFLANATGDVSVLP